MIQWFHWAWPRYKSDTHLPLSPGGRQSSWDAGGSRWSLLSGEVGPFGFAWGDSTQVGHRDTKQNTRRKAPVTAVPMEGDVVPLLISRSSDQWVSKGVKTLLLRTEKVAIKPADTEHSSFQGRDNCSQNSWRATNRQYWLCQDKKSKKWSFIPKNGNSACARSDCLCLQRKRKPWVITLTRRLPAANQALNSHLCSLHILQMKCCWHSCFTTCQNSPTVFLSVGLPLLCLGLCLCCTPRTKSGISCPLAVVFRGHLVTCL